MKYVFMYLFFNKIRENSDSFIDLHAYAVDIHLYLYMYIFIKNESI